MEPSSVITEPRYLKLVTVSSFCPFTLISVLMPLVWFCHQLGLLGTDLHAIVPAGSPSRGGDVVVYVFNKKTNKLAYSFFSSSVLVSVSVFMTLSTVFHSISSPDNSPLSHFVFPVSFLPYESFQLYISL